MGLFAASQDRAPERVYWHKWNLTVICALCCKTAKTVGCYLFTD